MTAHECRSPAADGMRTFYALLTMELCFVKRQASQRELRSGPAIR